MVIAGAAWWATLRIYTGIAVEDALITHRIAQNLASGQGFAYNPGERVLGTTTPLSVLTLGLAGSLFGPQAIRLASSIVMPLFGILAGILNYMIFRKLNYSQLPSLVSVVLFFAHGLIAVTSVGGMETPMVVFFMALSAYCFLQGRYTWVLVACSLLVLTRIDGVVWSFLMFVSIVLKDRRFPTKPVLAAVLVQLPWLVFALAYFGTVIPHTIWAKRAISSIAATPLLSLKSLAGFGWWYSYCLGYGLDSRVFFLWLPIVCLGAYQWWRGPQRNTLTRMVVLYPICYGAFLFSGKAPHFYWYLTPAVWSCLLFAAAGIDEWASLCARCIRWVPAAPLKVAITGVILLGYCTQNRGKLEAEYLNTTNELGTRRVVGLWLRANTPPDSVVAMEAIGYQGFYCERRVLISAVSSALAL